MRKKSLPLYTIGTRKGAQRVYLKAFYKLSRTRCKYLPGYIPMGESWEPPGRSQLQQLGRSEAVQRSVRLHPSPDDLEAIEAEVLREFPGWTVCANSVARFLQESLLPYMQMVYDFEIATNPPAPPVRIASIGDVCNGYMQHVIDEGMSKSSIKAANRICTDMEQHYRKPISSMSFEILREVREVLVESGLSRKGVNARINRIKTAIYWAAQHDLIDPELATKFKFFARLKPYRTKAREIAPVDPVAWETVYNTLPHMASRCARRMVLIHWYTGARSSEICNMTRGQLGDMTLKVWEWVPLRHKGNHLERDKIVFIGPRAQEIIKEALADPTHRIRGRRNEADEPVFPTRLFGHPKAASYGACVRRACERAGIKPWHPHQIRHSRATAVGLDYGLEAAAAVLGNTLEVTQVYNDSRNEMARQVAEASG